MIDYASVAVTTAAVMTSALGVTGKEAARLSRAVGARQTVEADVCVLAPREGDQATEELVRKANEGGGVDNVTALVIQVRKEAA